MRKWLLLVIPLAALAQQESELPYYKSGVPWKREFACKPDPAPPAADPPGVSYSQPKAWLRQVTSKSEGRGGIVDQYALQFFDFGGIASGPQAGARLVVSKFYSWRSGSEDGLETATIRYQRYLLKDNRLTRLAAISDPPSNAAVYANLLRQLGVNLAPEDTSFRIAMLAAPIQHVSVNNLCLTFWEQLPEEKSGNQNSIGTHPLYGRFYPGDGHYVHAKLPDGTVLAYYLLPPPALDTMGGKSSGPFSCFEQDYMAEKNGGMSGPAADVTYQPDMSLDELRLLYDLPGIGKIYVQRHPPKDSYAEYKAMWDSYFKDPEPGSKVKKIPQLSAAEFARAIPEFYWRDPLGRWVFFQNTYLRFAVGAEPLIYLYPRYTQTVSVRLGHQLQILGAIPPLSDHSWQVEANPDGLMSLGTARFETLFWEGKWVPLAPSESGFVVKQEDVDTFLESTLADLGLNEKESQDFRRYWVGRMQDHPYFLINFLDRETIDTIAPLELSPAPDTFIRVLMDFIALDEPAVLPTPQLPPTPVRRGFVAVEWGGMSR